MKKSIKILSAVLSAMMLMLLTLTGCGSSQTTSDEGSTQASAPSGATLRVGVIQYISHSSLDNCYQGIEEALQAKYGENVIIDRQIGSDSSADADCATYANNMVAQGYDMIIAIATPAASSAYAATEGTDIPVIFCSVSDPVSAKLVNSIEEPGTLCTGTSDVLDLEGQVDMIQQLQPDVETIGVLYTTSEVNSITQLNNLTEICEARGITVQASGVQNASDIPAAAAALAAEVDCINNFTDNNVVNNLSVVLDAANAAGIPVYGSEIEQVKKGCLASNSMDYVAIGRTTGNMAAEVLDGADITTMAVRTVSDSKPVVNSEVLEALNLTMPESLMNEAETIVTEE